MTPITRALSVTPQGNFLLASLSPQALSFLELGWPEEGELRPVGRAHLPQSINTIWPRLVVRHPDEPSPAEIDY